jgi:HSP20 family protein
MLMRFDPFRDVDRLTQALMSQGTARPSTMPMDAYREGDQFIVEFDLPGVDPGSIDLTVEKNALTVRAQRNWEPKENQEVLIAERPQGTFTRQLFLGESLDSDNVQATYEQWCAPARDPGGRAGQAAQGPGRGRWRGSSDPRDEHRGVLRPDQVLVDRGHADEALRLAGPPVPGPAGGTT